MEEDGDVNSLVWRHPLITHSKEPLSSPLTTFTSETLQAEAVKLFKSVQLFMSVVLDSSGIDYHVVLAQNAIQQGLQASQELPDERHQLVLQRLLPEQTVGTGLRQRHSDGQQVQPTQHGLHAGLDADGYCCVCLRAQEQQTSLAPENSLQQKQRLNN